jgi:adenylosuccinate lyase
MASPYRIYHSPLESRYCSEEMKSLFSMESRHSTWRKLWLFLAQSEKELGIDTITDKAIQEMEAHLVLTDEDFKTARMEEEIRRHVSLSSNTHMSMTSSLTGV